MQCHMAVCMTHQQLTMSCKTEGSLEKMVTVSASAHMENILMASTPLLRVTAIRVSFEQPSQNEQQYKCRQTVRQMHFIKPSKMISTSQEYNNDTRLK
jgi:carboxypeptidase C (cathepsin A)